MEEEPPTPYCMGTEHNQLDALVEEILTLITRGDWTEITAAFDRAEDRILAHLDAEEAALLAGYAVVAPSDAALLLDDHAGIRDALAEVGIDVDLRALWFTAARRLVERLRAHTRREIDGLYPWANGRQPEMDDG